MSSVKRVMMILMAISRTQTVVMIVKNTAALAGPAATASHYISLSSQTLAGPSATASHYSSLPSQTLAGPSATASHHSSLSSQSKTVINVLHVLFVAYTLIALAGPSATASHYSSLPSQSLAGPSATAYLSSTIPSQTLVQPSATVSSIAVSPVSLTCVFTGNPGRAQGAIKGNSPIDFFNAFFDENVKDLIYTETTCYAEQDIRNTEAHLQLHKHARGNQWKHNPMNREEVNILLSVLIVMGVVGFLTQRSYWSTKWPLNCDIFKGIITGRRFDLLMRYLYLNDKDKMPPKGSKTPGVTEKGLGHKVATELVSDYRDKGYTLFMDNYYSSPKLFNDLVKSRFCACSTVRSDRRGIKQTFKDKVLSI
uniref:PiggyBac transposable element-derived protein domain-containing protein n=1 Tax=Amphimedon queenslandica TaxID=400682 RepID=A0A1X7T5W6_AMPQE